MGDQILKMPQKVKKYALLLFLKNYLGLLVKELDNAINEINKLYNETEQNMGSKISNNICFFKIGIFFRYCRSNASS